MKIKNKYNVVDDISITLFTAPEDPPGYQTLIIKTNDNKYSYEQCCPDIFYAIQAILMFLEKEIDK